MSLSTALLKFIEKLEKDIFIFKEEYLINFTPI